MVLNSPRPDPSNALPSNPKGPATRPATVPTATRGAAFLTNLLILDWVSLLIRPFFSLPSLSRPPNKKDLNDIVSTSKKLLRVLYVLVIVFCDGVIVKF